MRANHRAQSHSSKRLHSPYPPRAPINLTVQLIKAFDERNPPIESIVPLSTAYESMKGNLIGKTTLLCAGSDGGTTSAVKWALKSSPQIQLVHIDCSLYKTDTQFVRRMTEVMGSNMNQIMLSKDMVIKEKINFAELNQIIFLNNQKFLLYLSKSQRLTKQRQFVLYMLMEWMKTKIRKNLGLVIATRQARFENQLKARVRSRMQEKVVYYLAPPSVMKAKQVILKRIELLLMRARDSFPAQEILVVNKIYDAIKMFELFEAALLQKCWGFASKKQELESPSLRSIPYYLNLMKMVFSSGGWITSVDFNAISIEQLCLFICNQIGKVRNFNYTQQNVLTTKFQNMDYPELIIMGIIRLKFMDVVNNKGLAAMNLGNIYERFQAHLRNNVRNCLNNTSFNYSKNLFKRAIHRLCDERILSMKESDQLDDNTYLISHTGPEHILYYAQQIKDLPYFIKLIFCD